MIFVAQEKYEPQHIICILLHNEHVKNTFLHNIKGPP